MSRLSRPSLRPLRRLSGAVVRVLVRLGRAVHAAREQLAYNALTLTLIVVGYLVAIEGRGEPVRSHAALILLVAFAFLAGWLHEIHRPGGSYDLHEQLDKHRPERDAS